MKKLKHIHGLQELEQAKQWDKAIDLLYNIWVNDKDNCGTLCRLIAECWYIMVEWDQSICKDNLSYESIKNTLIKATQYGLEHFSNEVDFLWIVGYMISMFPYLFYSSNLDLYTEWEDKGVDMLKKAIQLEPSNKIVEILYLGTKGCLTNKIISLKKRLLPNFVELFFDGKTAIEDYFIEILLHKGVIRDQ